MKKILSFLLALLALVLPAACASAPASTEAEDALPDRIVITVKDFGVIKAELYPEKAPVTVANFKKLVSENYYDGTTFHRVIEGFMIQGGAGRETASIRGEFEANGVDNDLKHERGVLSMARAKDMNSASSQFFICHKTEGCGHLNGQYAAFGKVTEGLEVVDAIASVQTGLYDAPVQPVVIESIRFEQA